MSNLNINISSIDLNRYFRKITCCVFELLIAIDLDIKKAYHAFVDPKN